MTFNQQLIEKARKGEIAILNDGSVEELQKVVKEAWPTDIPPSGDTKYYFADRYRSTTWRYDDKTNLPAHSVKDFFMTDTTTDSKSYLTEITKPQSQPRTYKVTRSQMKKIWMLVNSTSLRDLVLRYFDCFEDEVDLSHEEVKWMIEKFLGEEVQKLFRLIFPEYFFIHEGELVLCRDKDDEEWVVRVSNGGGKVYSDGYISNQDSLEVPYKQIIPYTKQPPK